MDNGIPARQNEEASLRQLAAKRHFYSKAKRVARLQFGAAVCLPIGLLLLDFFQPSARLWIAFAGLILALIDETVLDRWKSALRTKAARIQETFDAHVLQMAWSDMIGHPVGREDLLAPVAANADRSKLLDWYTQIVGSVSLAEGRIICQRANCVWDSKQRRYYGMTIAVMAAVVMVALSIVALQRALSLPDFVLSVLAPAFPFLLWSIRQEREHREAAERLDQMCLFGDRLWKAALSRTVPDSELALESRRLQDAIYQHRESSPLVPEWFYTLLRDRFQHTLMLSTEEMVKEAKR